MNEDLRAELEDRMGGFGKRNRLAERPVLQIALGVYAGIMMAVVTLWLLSWFFLVALLSAFSAKTDFPKVSQWKPPAFETRTQTQEYTPQRLEQQPLSACIKSFEKIDEEVRRCMTGEIPKTW